MIYAVRLDRALSDEENALFLDITDGERRIKTERQYLRKRAEAGLVGDMLARLALKKEFGINLKNLNFSRSETGKPFVAEYPGVHFNVSHSGDVVVCVVSESPVGIDVEKIKTVKDSVKERVCTAKEFEKIKAAVNPDEEFIKLWTQKEAVVKKYGTGIVKGDLKNCLANENVNSLKFGDCIISVSY